MLVKNRKIEDTFFIGSHGRVEVQVNNSPDYTPRIVAIAANDPSQHLGSMDNPVVKLIEKQFIDQGFTTVKMNYKGVGRSSGKFEGGEKELINATLLIDWILSNYIASELWIAGFSYGSWVAMQIMMRRPEVSRFIVASSLCNKYDFSFLSPCPTSGLIIHGTADSLTPAASLREFTHKSSSKNKKHRVDISHIEGADHFFRHKEDEFAKVITEYIVATIAETNEALQKIASNPEVQEIGSKSKKK